MQTITKRDNPNSLRYNAIDDHYKRRAHSILRKIFTENCNYADRILEVGCGGGVIGRIRQSPVNVVGVEYDTQLVKIAKKNCEKVYQLNLNEFSSNEITEKNFDLILLFGVLEHLLYPKNTTIEVLKLLKPEGLVVVSLPNIAQIQFRLKLLFGNFDRTDAGVLCDEHYHLYTYKTALKLIKDAGLEVVKFYPSGTIVSFLPILPKLLAAELIFLCKKSEKKKTHLVEYEGLWYPRHIHDQKKNRR